VSGPAGRIIAIVLARLRFRALLFLFVAGSWLTQPAQPNPQVVAGEGAAHAQCATCHKLPPPDVLQRR
jgi:hypothetical protein